MTFDLPNVSWEAISTDPGKYAQLFRSQEDEHRRHAYKFTKLRKFAEALLDKQEELNIWKSDGIPDHPNRQARSAEEAEPGDVPRDRRARVCKLAAQSPERLFKVRDIAQELGIENEKSLRTSLDSYVHKDHALKKNSNAEYSAGPRVAEYAN
ncbi:hypothetical protein [Amycolatopsis sp. H20-H5]|uniref:hypothetical protein n=1 Tax=Amycolatopsis sp. H20-H5 TaxID=3046309 RepID=UPI002DB7B0E5|nr:hypothetical protein [Amycolatopsis sp. H20-H5]MEC3978193.1 hypothetical protein [Amycolatopsis sp. H20-H5]